MIKESEVNSVAFIVAPVLGVMAGAMLLFDTEVARALGTFAIIYFLLGVAFHAVKFWRGT